MPREQSPYSLSSEESERIFQEKILNDSKISFHDVPTSTSPKAILLAGQPGAGKSNLMRKTMDALKGEAVVADPDALRRFHPAYEQLKKDFPFDWSSHTHPDAAKWSDMLKKHAIKHKKNFIADGTLSSPKWAVKEALEYLGEGYIVEVKALSVNQLESDHGVYKRFFDEFEAEGTGRWVPEDYRNKAYYEMPNSLGALEGIENPPIPVKVYDRSGNLIYDGYPPNSSKSQLLKHRESYINNEDKAKEIKKNWKNEVDRIKKNEKPLKKAGLSDKKIINMKKRAKSHLASSVNVLSEVLILSDKKPKNIKGCLGMLAAEVALDVGLEYAADAVLRAVQVGVLEANKVPPAPPPPKNAVTVTHQIKHASLLAALAGAVVGALLAAATAAVAAAVVGATGGAALVVGIGAMVVAGPLIGKAASAVTDFVDSFFPADDGPVVTGSPNVFVEGLNSARAKDDMVACVKHSPPPPIAQGSDSVYINNQPAVRVEHKTACGAPIKQGAKTVYIGGNTTTVMDIADEFSFWEKALIMGVEFLIPPTRGLFKAITKAPKMLATKLPGVVKAAMKGARNAFRSKMGKLSGKTFKSALKKGKGALKSALAGLCGLKKGRKSPKRSNAKNPGNNKTPINCKIGNPVDPIKGDVIKDVVDFTLGQSIPLSLKRYYRSSNKKIGLFGQGWVDSFSEHLVIDQDKRQITLHAPEGLVVTFDVPQGTNEVFNRRYPHLYLAIYPQGYVIKNTEDHVFHYYQYQTQGKASLVAIADRHGNHIRFHQNEHQLPEYIEHSDGITLELHYQANQVTRIDRLLDGRRDTLAKYQYQQQLLTYAWSKGQTDESITYNKQRLMRSICYHKQSEVHYFYDKQERCVQMRGSEGFHHWDFTYQPECKTNSARDRNNNVWRFIYNNDKQVVKEINPDQQAHHFIYDHYGILIEEINAAGQHTYYQHDPWTGKLVQTEDRLGRITKLTYDDDMEQLIAVETPEGKTSYHYQNHQITHVQYPNKQTLFYRYDEKGNLKAVVKETGEKLQFDYDQHNRLTTASDWLQQEQQYQYNQHDQLSQLITPRGHQWKYYYDQDNRLTEIVDPLNYREKQAYNRAHQPRVYTDANQHQHSVKYGVFGLPVKQVDAEGNATTFEYDKVHQYLTQVTNANGDSWLFDYDAVGNLIKETDYNGHITRYTYTSLGQLASKKTPIGDTTRYFYDAGGRLVQKHTKEGASVYDWDDQDRLIQLKTPNNTLQYQYNDTGQLIEENQNGQVIRYEYDELGHRKARHIQVSPWYPEGEVQSTYYHYDANGQLIKLTLPEQDSLTLDYDAEGNLIHQASTRGYINDQRVDAKGRMSQQQIGRDEHPDFVVGFPKQDEQPQFSFINRSYTYDAVDNLLRCDSPSGHTQWAYNKNDQVTEHRHNWQTEHYQYNNRLGIQSRTGHRGNKSYQYSASGQLKEVRHSQQASYHYRYDVNGRLIEKLTERNGFRNTQQRYEWNSEDQLIKVITQQGHHWHYQYDGLGRRVLKHNSTTNETTYILWDGNTVAREISIHPEDGRQAGEEQIVNITDLFFMPGTFTPLAQQTRSNQAEQHQHPPISANTLHTRYIATDHMGTVIALFSVQGDLVWENKPSLWGKPNGQYRGLGQFYKHTSCALGFQGQYFDKETGLHYNYHRYYDADMGQYISPDPIGLLGGLHPQAYVHNPNGWVDPWGLDKCEKNAGVTKGGLNANPFKGKSFQEIDEMLTGRGFKKVGPDPASGKGAYFHPKSGRKYYLDKGGEYREGTELPHVDVHRMRDGANLEKEGKRRYPLGDKLLEPK